MICQKHLFPGQEIHPLGCFWATEIHQQPTPYHSSSDLLAHQQQLAKTLTELDIEILSIKSNVGINTKTMLTRRILMLPDSGFSVWMAIVGCRRRKAKGIVEKENYVPMDLLDSSYL